MNKLAFPLVAIVVFAALVSVPAGHDLNSFAGEEITNSGDNIRF